MVLLRPRTCDRGYRYRKNSWRGTNYVLPDVSKRNCCTPWGNWLPEISLQALTCQYFPFRYPYAPDTNRKFGEGRQTWCGCTRCRVEDLEKSSHSRQQRATYVQYSTLCQQKTTIEVRRLSFKQFHDALLGHDGFSCVRQCHFGPTVSLFDRRFHFWSMISPFGRRFHFYARRFHFSADGFTFERRFHLLGDGFTFWPTVSLLGRQFHFLADSFTFWFTVSFFG